ncbi:hypothetical protein [Glacieibacterium frigidum]|uniref:hypothetical protein n=1 Tax=Glacieibacterium frigidum TaxID=2593303 RepID=UPI00163D9F83|nr:hypothetical protein [Glacieibacterium frigidum]
MFAAPSASWAQYIDYNAVNVTSNLQVLMRGAVAPGASSGRAYGRPSVPDTRTGGNYLARPAAPGMAATAFPYRSTSALRRAAADAFIQRTTKSDPAAGKAIAAQLAQHDYSRVYAGIVAPFGYRTDDAVDALAAYTLLGWLIANGAPDPSRADAAAVRAQVAAGLANDRRFSDPRTRAELAEEIKLLFVTLHAGWQSARKEGNLRPYADGVARMFQRFTGNDLRAMRLTERGFVRR